MTEPTRDTRLLQTFATLADTLVADYDVVDLLQNLVDTCQQLLDTTAAGILLADDSGELDVVASTSEEIRLVEVMQLSAEAGPCVESYRTGRVVSLNDIGEAPAAWDDFRRSALEHGFSSVHAIPLRLRETTIGTLNLLRDRVGPLDPDDLVAAKAFADVATIGILHERSLRESQVITEQLQFALNSRVVIEQAKGVVSHTRSVPVDEAFALIRAYARSHQLGIGTVAAQLVARTLHLPD
jgi:transcriptional regulator with GAF, ATPase, and Fis domain